MKTIRLAVAAVALIGGAGCGLHIVKYDPQEAAALSERISADFKAYKEVVRPIEGASVTESADIVDLGNTLDANLDKLPVLLRRD